MNHDWLQAFAIATPIAGLIFAHTWWMGKRMVRRCYDDNGRRKRVLR